MLEVVSIRLTPENASMLDVMQKRQALKLDDLINRALDNYFFASRFENVRARLSVPAAGEPEYTEEEIFRMVS